jgi:tetratricopeptide (TPR) repeat protein
VRGYTNGGDAFARGGDFTHALERYQVALKIDPDYMPARINAAVVYGQMGRAPEGIALLRDALTHETGQRGVVLYNLAELLRRGGERAEAMATYREAVAADARPELVYGRLGEMFAEDRDWSAARDAFREAIRAWEDPVVQYRNMLTVARDLPESDSVGVRAIEATLARGVTEADVARYDLAFIRGQLDHDADLGRLYGRLGAVEAQLGEIANATGHLTRALQIWPANPEASRMREMLANLGGGR